MRSITTSNGHLTFEVIRQTILKDLASATQRRYRQYYNRIISTWITPEEWFGSEDRNIKFKDDTSSAFYWVTWSILLGRPLDSAFLKTLNFQGSIAYLKLAGLNIEEIQKKLSEKWGSALIRDFWPLMLKLLLFTGKNKVEDILDTDVDDAFLAGIFKKTTSRTIYKGLFYLGIIWSSISKDRRDIIEQGARKRYESESRAIAGGHLSREEFINFKSVYYSHNVGIKHLLYDLVISKWPTTDSWYASDHRVFSLYNRPDNAPNITTTIYWIAWSLIKGKALDALFLRSFQTNNGKSVLNAAGAFEVDSVTKQRLYDEGCIENQLIPALLRHLLFCGKRSIYELNTDDIERAEKEDIGCMSTGYYQLRLALYLLKITSIPPKVLQYSIRKQQDIRIPEYFRVIAIRFVNAMGRRVFNESYKREKINHLAAFLQWWIAQNACETLREFRRKNWLDYIEYIKAKPDVSGKTQAGWLSVVPMLFDWGWVDCPKEMPPRFDISSRDYMILLKDHVRGSHKSFENSEDGDRLVEYIISLRPETIIEKMRRAAAIVHATTGMRSIEIAHLAINAWRWDEEDKVYKIVIVSVDKMRYQFRPIYITEEGVQAIQEVENIRRSLGNLAPRYDARIKEAYVHLFEYNGRLVASKCGMRDYLDKCKLECGIVDECGKPKKGCTHALRHRFARRVFEMSDGDIKAVQHLLGHKNVKMSFNYVCEDQGRRNADMRDLLVSGKITGKAKTILLWLLDENITIQAYVGWQKALHSSNTFGGLIKTGHARNLGYGWCINPCSHRKSCFNCINYLAEEEHIPELINLFKEHLQEFAYEIHFTANGDIEAAFRNTRTRRSAALLSVLIEHLEQLGIARGEILRILSEGGSNANI